MLPTTVSTDVFQGRNRVAKAIAIVIHCLCRSQLVIRLWVIRSGNGRGNWRQKLHVGQLIVLLHAGRNQCCGLGSGEGPLCYFVVKVSDCRKTVQFLAASAVGATPRNRVDRGDHTRERRMWATGCPSPRLLGQLTAL